MKRILLLAIGAVALALIGFVGFVVFSGGRPTYQQVANAPENVAVAPVDVPVQPTAPVESGDADSARVAEDGAARTEFERWSTALKGRGLAVSTGSIGYEEGQLAVTDFEVSGSWRSLEWRWTSASALVNQLAEPKFDLRLSGVQTLELAQSGRVASWSGDAGSVVVRLLDPQSRAYTTTLISIEDIELENAADGSEISLYSGELRINLGEGIVPPSSAKLAKLALPFWADEPFGAALNTLEGEFVDEGSEGTGLSLSKLSFVWGALAASGSGSVGVSEDLELQGQLDLDISNPLAALDALRAVRPLDAGAMAEAYAVLLDDMASTEPDAFRLILGPDAMTLSGAAPDIDLVNTRPLMPVH